MKSPIILQRLELDPKIFISKSEFRFNDSLSLIQGFTGTGKSTLLKIIGLLTFNSRTTDIDIFNHFFKHMGEHKRSFTFKYDINPEYFDYNHPIRICIKVTETGAEISSEPTLSKSKIDQIILNLNILYINFENLDSIYYSGNREAFERLSSCERSLELLKNETELLENVIILIDDLETRLDTVNRLELSDYLIELSKRNQIIFAAPFFKIFDYAENFNFKEISIFMLEDPFRKTRYDFFQKDPKSNFYKEFQLNIENIKKTLELKLEIQEKPLQDFLTRILFANIITAMETYLSDCFIDKVTNNQNFIPKLLELTPEFNSQIYTLKNAYDWIENVNENIINVLSGISFHNLRKISSMYKNILNIIFPSDMGDIFRAVLIRHDIVHRNGKTKDNQEIIIKRQDLINLIEKVSSFIRSVDLQSRKI